MLSFRTAGPDDWTAIWSIMEPVVRGGETYCWDTGMDEPSARAEWLPGPTGADPTLVVFVAADPSTGAILGTAQLHANRGGNGAHVANASFLVADEAAGRGVGRALAGHVLGEAVRSGYTAMQFNAVVETNTRAVALWSSLGFAIVGTVPGAFRHPALGATGLHIMHRFLDPVS
ncbi:GNAT family N-acetyltransferase [Arthrobacter agilis]|uniref:GNAT family N-acetyltransferase n=1 Tax=Arthrobacter agilis TaxID=37921 RepID=UPI002366622E|nr:GNAT family N-acetyltransferase [Arthrobacter agilis]WDF32604.1 GNAT family N-acetyltransferase [Arthrobacter agilis]